MVSKVKRIIGCVFLDGWLIYVGLISKKPAISNGFAYCIGLSWMVNGGSTWESNPPGRFLIPPTGFEDRAAHQRPTCFLVCRYLNHSQVISQYKSAG